MTEDDYLREKTEKIISDEEMRRRIKRGLEVSRWLMVLGLALSLVAVMLAGVAILFK